MLVTDESLQRVDDHWAVAAIGTDCRERGLLVAQARLVRAAVGQQLTLQFVDQPDDEHTLQQLAMAYELAAVEGLRAVLAEATGPESRRLREQCHAGAWRAFEMRRMLPIPGDQVSRFLHVLHLGALAYCGDRWSDLRRWLAEHGAALDVSPVDDAPWDRRILVRLFDCWVRLFRKRSWDDLSIVATLIAELRREQTQYECKVLTQSNCDERVVALRLIALYHWAKATELLSQYVMQGTPTGIAEELDKHFEASREAAAVSQDAALEVLLGWLHVTARRMVAGSVWWVGRSVNSRVTQFLRNVTRSRALFELLPPQRAALQEQGLLDPAHRAVVVEMPTSGGKTLLAEFRMLQALNQFDQDNGWVAYVAPTRALVTQITRRLRMDFEPFGIAVEQLTGAVEVDTFEEDLLTAPGEADAFAVLVVTPEKLQLVLRNKKVARPLALVVMDEAHNIEDEERGLRIELLLATIRRECQHANFMLLMPFVPNGQELANWLAPGACQAISIGTGAWKPNERIVGLFWAEPDNSQRAGWQMVFETLTTRPKTLHLRGVHRAGTSRPLEPAQSDAVGAPTVQAAAMAKIFSSRGTSIAIGTQIPHVWSMARRICKTLNPLDSIADEIGVVQRFLQTEIGDDFELVDMLSRGVAVHHAGLPDEARTLIEWLAELGLLRVLGATTTIAQGINFPVSSIFLASNKYPYGKEMSPREFWNLAGRAGRFGQDSVGIVGIAQSNQREELTSFVSRATGALVSRLIRLLDDLDSSQELGNLATHLNAEQWRDFRCYVAHLWAEKQNLDAVLADTEQLLRSTYGYTTLRAEQSVAAERKANALLDATKQYVRKWVDHPEDASLADSTGFAPEGVRSALLGLNALETKLTPADWEPASLFGDVGRSTLPNLIGVMMQIPELGGALKELGKTGLTKRHIAEITLAWVNGESVKVIAEKYFRGEGDDSTAALTNACRAIYRTLVNSGPWGLSALSKLPTSGLDFQNMSPDMQRRLNALPAMIYHGVRTEEAVLMRMNSVPRTLAEPLGARFAEETGDAPRNASDARAFIRALEDRQWANALPTGATMTGPDCRKVWCVLSGERDRVPAEGKG